MTININKEGFTHSDRGNEEFCSFYISQNLSKLTNEIQCKLLKFNKLLKFYIECKKT
mgnify:CR=1 FL=1